jgi:hypothetical protein
MPLSDIHYSFLISIEIGLSTTEIRVMILLNLKWTWEQMVFHSLCLEHKMFSLELSRTISDAYSIDFYFIMSIVHKQK